MAVGWKLLPPLRLTLFSVIFVSIPHFSSGLTCGSDQFRCTQQAEDKCLHISKKCNNYVECSNGKDEEGCFFNCHDQFMCIKSKACLPITKLCDGVKDCQGGEDELCLSFTSTSTTDNPLNEWISTSVYFAIGGAVLFGLIMIIISIVACRLRSRNVKRRHVLQQQHRTAHHRHATNRTLHDSIANQASEVRLHRTSAVLSSGNLTLNSDFTVQLIPASNPPAYPDLTLRFRDDEAPPPYMTVDRRGQVVNEAGTIVKPKLNGGQSSTQTRADTGHNTDTADCATNTSESNPSQINHEQPMNTRDYTVQLTRLIEDNSEQLPTYESVHPIELSVPPEGDTVPSQAHVTIEPDLMQDCTHMTSDGISMPLQEDSDQTQQINVDEDVNPPHIVLDQRVLPFMRSHNAMKASVSLPILTEKRSSYAARDIPANTNSTPFVGRDADSKPATISPLPKRRVPHTISSPDRGLSLSSRVTSSPVHRSQPCLGTRILLMHRNREHTRSNPTLVSPHLSTHNEEQDTDSHTSSQTHRRTSSESVLDRTNNSNESYESRNVTKATSCLDIHPVTSQTSEYKDTSSLPLLFDPRNIIRLDPREARALTTCSNSQEGDSQYFV